VFFGIDSARWRKGWRFGLALGPSFLLIAVGWIVQVLSRLPLLIFVGNASVFCGSSGLSADNTL
jgi:hypothetical protein